VHSSGGRRLLWSVLGGGALQVPAKGLEQSNCSRTCFVWGSATRARRGELHNEEVRRIEHTVLYLYSTKTGIPCNCSDVLWDYLCIVYRFRIDSVQHILCTGCVTFAVTKDFAFDIASNFVTCLMVSHCAGDLALEAVCSSRESSPGGDAESLRAVRAVRSRT
jgi:hypothetical protein